MDPAGTAGGTTPTTGTAPTGSDRPGSGQGTTGAASEAAQGAVDKAKTAVTDTAAQAKDQARDLVGEARSQLRGRADEGAKQLGGTLRSASDELHQMAGAASGGSVATQVTTQLAGGLGKVADRLDEGGLQSVMQDVEDFARRHPGRFLLGAMVAGFAVGRVVQHSDTQSLQRVMKDAVSGGSDGGSSQPERFAGAGDLDLTTSGTPGTSVYTGLTAELPPASPSIDSPVSPASTGVGPSAGQLGGLA